MCENFQSGKHVGFWDIKILFKNLVKLQSLVHNLSEIFALRNFPSRGDSCLEVFGKQIVVCHTEFYVIRSLNEYVIICFEVFLVRTLKCYLYEIEPFPLKIETMLKK